MGSLESVCSHSFLPIGTLYLEVGAKAKSTALARLERPPVMNVLLLTLQQWACDYAIYGVSYRAGAGRLKIPSFG